jgi:hypothetical protein
MQFVAVLDAMCKQIKAKIETWFLLFYSFLIFDRLIKPFK